MARYRGYGQFCPLAKAVEVLGERWTLLVVRELVLGSRRFNELRRGIPMVSPTMLSLRLRELEDAGVIARRPRRRGSAAAVEYELTAAGQELGPIVAQLGGWGHRWAVSDLRREDLDPSYLMWAAHRSVRTETLGPGRVVIAFELLDAPAAQRYWWLVIDEGRVDLCFKHPGFDVDVTVLAKLRPLALLSLGQLAPGTAVRSGEVHLRGAAALVRSFSAWYPRSFDPPARARRSSAAR